MAPHTPSTRRALTPATAALAAALTCVGITACGEPGRSTERYCGEVQTNLVAIATPAIATPDDVTATLEAYRTVAAQAPAAIEPEWQVMIGSLETAATVVPNDPASMATVTDAALSSQPAATRIQQYTQQTCGIAIGTPPPPTNPATATTMPPDTTGG
ncbi:MAG: hypothetical protein WD023_01955 [Ilumatobacteraceae bacterium]